LQVATWTPSDYNTSVVYVSGEGGYACLKIPVLLATRAGTLLAFAEARKDDCSDFAWTDLVVKRSEDGGLTWSQMQVIRSESGPGLPHTVIGNAAPAQLLEDSRYPGRIVVPHTRNNSDVWRTWSDDDGLTWAKAEMIPGGSAPGWKWVGTGPPASLVLRRAHRGRIIVPSYHSKYRGNLANNIVHGHVMLSDDDGDTFRLASVGGFGAADKKTNENQAVELGNGSVLINARSLANPLVNQERIQTRSDDGGETFGPTRFVPELPQPVDGCEGSLVAVDEAGSQALYYSGPDSKVLRTGMSVWKSGNEGESWSKVFAVDAGMSGYSAMQAVPKGLALLYEQSDEQQVVMNPDRFVFRVFPLGAHSLVEVFV